MRVIKKLVKTVQCTDYPASVPTLTRLKSGFRFANNGFFGE